MHLIWVQPETNSARCWIPCKKRWVSSVLISGTESPSRTGGQGPNSNPVLSPTPPRLSLVGRSGFPENWSWKTGNNSILEGGNNLLWRSPLPSATNTRAFLRELVPGVVDPGGGCLEGHTQHRFLLRRAAIILNVLSAAKCLIYKPVFMATVHTHTGNLQTILPSSPQYINLQHSWQSMR